MKRSIAELNKELDTKKYPTRQDMREIMWGYREATEQLLKEYQRLLNKVNKITSYYRHSIPIPDKALTELVNRQIDVEQAVRKLRG